MSKEAIESEESFRKVLEFLGCQYREDIYWEADHDGTPEEDTRVHNGLERMARGKKPVEEWKVITPIFEQPDRVDYYELYEVDGKRFIIQRENGPFTSYIMDLELFKEFKYSREKSILVLYTFNGDMCPSFFTFADDINGLLDAQEEYKEREEDGYYTEGGIFRMELDGSSLEVNIATRGSGEMEGTERLCYFNKNV